MLPGGDLGRAVLGVIPGESDLQALVIGGIVTVLVAVLTPFAVAYARRADRRAGEIKAELKPNGGSSAFDAIERRFGAIDDRLGHHDRLLERIDQKLDDMRGPPTTPMQ